MTEKSAIDAMQARIELLEEVVEATIEYLFVAKHATTRLAVTIAQRELDEALAALKDKEQT